MTWLFPLGDPGPPLPAPETPLPARLLGPLPPFLLPLANRRCCRCRHRRRRCTLARSSMFIVQSGGSPTPSPTFTAHPHPRPQPHLHRSPAPAPASARANICRVGDGGCGWVRGRVRGQLRVWREEEGALFDYVKLTVQASHAHHARARCTCSTAHGPGKPCTRASSTRASSTRASSTGAVHVRAARAAQLTVQVRHRLMASWSRGAAS